MNSDLAGVGVLGGKSLYANRFTGVWISIQAIPYNLVTRIGMISELRGNLPSQSG